MRIKDAAYLVVYPILILGWGLHTFYINNFSNLASASAISLILACLFPLLNVILVICTKRYRTFYQYLDYDFYGIAFLHMLLFISLTKLYPNNNDWVVVFMLALLFLIWIIFAFKVKTKEPT